ncbi:HindIII family type II restriction endonuclease [Sporolactobacillus terrae]|uniref:HindIII family type II restriction endonuclease n=1 Tax=Sporolactobacillus terrae TaxID=269673 RepID=UPI001CBE9C63|nr:HindIII family type II restriction endonuclease [Sporolactobacillus terrae]UAK16126.1 HindIII family type II restriction endonuclease [Sporolactobacillus terrae]
MVNAFLLMKYVNNNYDKDGQLIGDHEHIANKFLDYLKRFNDESFSELLVSSTFIPDFYKKDSSQETLFTKLVEAMVCDWARRMGFRSTLIKEKSSYEDVNITIDNQLIVVDTKTFRLGRSQAAPNVKDFLKLEDIRKWCDRHEDAIGGLVTYPHLHEWKEGSDAYTYCSTKDIPTVMLSYVHLAYLLHMKSNFETNSLSLLWNYDKIFPEKLFKKMPGGNKKAYWGVMQTELINITNSDRKTYSAYINKYNKITLQAVKDIINSLKSNIEYEAKKAIAEVKEMDFKQIREEYAKYKIKQETSEYKKILNNVEKFRLK